MKVSIVTAARNASATLERMRASVMAQDMRAWEHLIVDDGSTDDTAAIVAGWASRDPRVRLFRQSPAGASAARNRGLAEARGEWLLFLDSDDTIEPGHLRRMLARTRAGADVVCCGYARWGRDGGITTRHRPPALDEDPIEAMASGPPTAIHGVLVRRERVSALSGFDQALATNEDWDLWLRLAASGAAFAVEPAPLAGYWSTQGSLSRDGVRMLRDARTILRRMDDLRPGLRDTGVEVLARALWSGASALAGGRDATPLVNELLPLGDLPGEHAVLVDAFLDGLVVGGGRPFSGLIELWPEISTAAEAFLAACALACAAPGIDVALLREIEWHIVRTGLIQGRRRVGGTLAVSLLCALTRGIDPPDDCEVVIVKASYLRPRSLAMAAEPALARLSGRDVARLIWSHYVGRIHQRILALPEGPANLAARAFVLARRALRRLTGFRPPSRQADEPDETAPKLEPGGGTGADWDEFFKTEDPWNYGSPYEQLKYQRTLDLLPPDAVIESALELACAEGLFTTMLARRVGALTATDISTTALARAQARCEGAGNVAFAPLDFFNQPIGGPWGLIVASEVLYYMGEPGQLAAFAAKVRDALVPGGWFLHAHAYEVTDEPNHTGFDWGDPFGVQTISRVFQAQPGLERVEAVTTDLYLIELYRRIEDGAVAHPVEALEVALETELDVSVASGVVWNGAIKTRLQVEQEERAFDIPVLMYHRVARDGPAGLAEWRCSPETFEHQLRFLRRRGYRSITVEEWDRVQDRSASFRGRPVLVTFDDAYLDFHQTAWPILERNGFSAHVFVVTGKVGTTSDWDAAHGEPAPLMTWDHIIELHGCGATFGSHLETHRPADGMLVRDLLGEASRSREILEAKLRVPIRSLAPPYGASNARVERVCAAAGYTRLFEAGGGMARAWGPKLRTPRIDIAGYDDIDAFAAKLGRAVEPPESADLP